MRFTCVKVGDLCEQIRGVSYEKGEALTSPRPGYVPILRANNITDRGLVYDELVYVPEQRVSAYQRLRRFDVVIAASSGSKDVVGKAAPVLDDFDGSFGAFCKVLRPNQKVDPRYFAHFFKTKHYRQTVSALAAGANISNLRNEHLEDLDIPLPSLSEQMRIAEMLDQAEMLVIKRAAALQQLNTLGQAVFMRLFGEAISASQLPVSLLGEVAEVVSGVTKGRQLRGQSVVEVPYLRVANVQAGFLDLSEVKTIPALPEEVEELRLLPGDVLMTEGGDYDKLGRGAIWDGQIANCIHQNHVFRVRVDRNRLDPKYFTYFLQTPFARRYFLRCAKRTTNLASINMTQLKALPVPLPPVALQREFVRRVEAVEQQIAQYRVSLAQLESLYASLQHRAFRGEL